MVNSVMINYDIYLYYVSIFFGIMKLFVGNSTVYSGCFVHNDCTVCTYMPALD